MICRTSSNSKVTIDSVSRDSLISLSWLFDSSLCPPIEKIPIGFETIDLWDPSSFGLIFNFRFYPFNDSQFLDSRLRRDGGNSSLALTWGSWQERREQTEGGGKVGENSVTSRLMFAFYSAPRRVATRVDTRGAAR